ncbi:MAG: hypothetical protein K8T26_11365 [Lentisphaerae bacterium]|nr:hypothetical protein [Lentisphaerota bacterium]
MSRESSIVVNVWGRKKRCKGVPEGAVLACIYELSCGLGETEEAAYVRVADGQVQLWICADTAGNFPLFAEKQGEDELSEFLRAETFGLSATGPSKGDLKSDAVGLLETFFQAQTGFQGPTRNVIRPGLVSESDYLALVDRLEHEYSEHIRKATEQASAIVAAADTLGLNPRPSGRGPSGWWANCPGTGHMIEIQVATNLFYCGYCRRGGGEAELRQFVAERRRKEQGL